MKQKEFFLYHGSRIQNLKTLNPRKGRNSEYYVFAVENPVLAVIFCNRPGSLLASWGKLNDNIPYFCELKPKIFQEYYGKISASIYKLKRGEFFQKEGFWEEEWISEKQIKVIEEIKIGDLKNYLVNREKDNDFKLILYNDRLKYFPNIDNEMIQTIMGLIKKYGKEKIIPFAKKHQPEVLAQMVKKQILL